MLRMRTDMVKSIERQGLGIARQMKIKNLIR